MSGASIEAALELWASSLRDAKARMRPLFTQERVAASAGRFLDGLLGPERRKTGWMRAEAAGDPGPWRQQAILGRGRWEAEALRDIVRDYALETLADPDAVLVIDETGFLKQGKASCGVGRQYTGSAGKITNCQIGVFAAYVSRHGHALIDRALYLPKAWTDDPARLAAAHVPPEVGFATKPRLAAPHGRARDRGRGAVPLGGGRQRLRGGRDRDGAAPGGQGLRARGQRHAASSPPGSASRWWPAPPRRSPRISTPPPGSACPRAKARRGRASTTGPTSNWPTSTRTSTGAGAIGLWTRGLLIRRSLADGECAYFTTWCPAGTTIEALVAVEGQRWAIEDALRDRQDRTRPRPQRDPFLARLASPRLAGHAGLRHAGGHPPPRQRAAAPKNPDHA